MKVLVSGASGFVGSALVAGLGGEGHEVWRLVRREPKQGEPEIGWNPGAGEIDAAGLEGFDAVVHLAGENIAEGRWTEAKKTRIRNSRVRGTELVARTLVRLASRPAVLISASAIGFYGDRGDEELDEGSPHGNGFLAEVCRRWEGASRVASEAGIRVVQLRTGMVLGAHGGALAKMLPVFRCGLGGPLGSGRQYVSWITRDDLVGVVRHALSTDTLEGPVNAVAPQPVTNRQFTRALGRAMKRPAVVPAPAFALRAALGQMADELLLASARVVPRRLQSTGFSFADPEIDGALSRLLGNR